MSWNSRYVRLAALLPAALLLVGSGDKPPPEVEQIIPRGVLEAIVDPDFVSADEADMPDDQWILGFQLDGVAHAYDLNLLNHHEVVNDVIAGKPVAAVW